MIEPYQNSLPIPTQIDDLPGQRCAVALALIRYLRDNNSETIFRIGCAEFDQALLDLEMLGRIRFTNQRSPGFVLVRMIGGGK